MQHLGSEDELKHVLREIVTTMSPEERLQGLSPDERLEGLSEEERLQGLTREQVEHLRQLLEQRRPADGNNANPKKS